MKFVFFYHSLISDWNNGNAHFLRGIASELILRGNRVHVLEPQNGWSLSNLMRDTGKDPFIELHRHYPMLASTFYDPGTLDLGAVLADADVVLVHEWNDPDLVGRIGLHRKSRSYRLFFHDTHHRSLSKPEDMQRYDLSQYDGVLAYGSVIRDIYLQRGWVRKAWTWHEAADTRIFRPMGGRKTADLVWIGNWGDDERARELDEFLFEPAVSLGLRTNVYGVRYPEAARLRLQENGLAYRGYLPNYEAPRVFARHRITVHVPRGPYVRRLPGIPTIRPFEALACGMALISSPWKDAEGLFTPGRDFLFARDGREMRAHIRMLLNDPAAADSFARHGRKTILERHTCRHRVDELFAILLQTRYSSARQTPVYPPLTASAPSLSARRRGEGPQRPAGDRDD